ncbi:MAG: thioesterase-like protein [Alphaproteobacteria bacterium]|nr:thioesterase-like protein [Alphaproteobacteria bacterium]
MKMPAPAMTESTATAPYPLPELVLDAPLAVHRARVLPEWVDWNGHMNVAFYVAAFDQASGAFMRNMGLGRSYVDGKHGMTFVLETHVTYDREMRQDAPMRFTTQLLDRDAKRVHLFHEMHHAELNYLAATNETVVINIDHASRRSAPWPDWARQRLDAIWATHHALAKPAKAGRTISLAKK